MITRTHGFDVLPGLFNHSGAFMTQHKRTVGILPVVNHADIRMTDSAGRRSHKGFVISRSFHSQLFDLERPVLFSQNGSPNLSCRHFF
jgi:hypothetical protein